MELGPSLRPGTHYIRIDALLSRTGPSRSDNRFPRKCGRALVSSAPLDRGLGPQRRREDVLCVLDVEKMILSRPLGVRSRAGRCITEPCEASRSPTVTLDRLREPKRSPGTGGLGLASLRDVVFLSSCLPGMVSGGWTTLLQGESSSCVRSLRRRLPMWKSTLSVKTLTRLTDSRSKGIPEPASGCTTISRVR